MTQKEEIAVALLLYRNYRIKINKESFKTSMPHLSMVEKITFHVAALADTVGCKKEFYEMLFKFPVMSIKIQELEKWDEQNPCVASPIEKKTSSNGHAGKKKSKGSWRLGLLGNSKQPKQHKKSSNKSQLKSKKKHTCK